MKKLEPSNIAGGNVKFCSCYRKNLTAPQQVKYIITIVISAVQLLNHVRLCNPMEAHQASLSFTVFLSLLNLMSIESVMPSNHLIFCCPLLLLPSIFPSIRVFSNELALCIRWPNYWGFSFSIRPFSEYSDSISFRIH